MKRTIIITVLFSLISSVSTYLLFHSMEGFKTEIKESKKVVKELKAEVNSIEENHKSEIQYWTAKNSDLQKQINETETNLNVSTQREKLLQGKIQALPQLSYARNLRLSSGGAFTSGSSPMGREGRGLKDLGEAKDLVTQYIAETNVRDSLCDHEISELKNVIQNKDSLAADCEKSFSMLKTVADSSITFQNKLTDDLTLADKKIKRGNLKTKFLSAGVMILATATTILLLEKKP